MAWNSELMNLRKLIIEIPDINDYICYTMLSAV